MNASDIQNNPSAALNRLRRDIILMAERSGHVAVALSCVDIIAALYFDAMDISPRNLAEIDRDHFILSKGHGCMALYAVLAHAGFINPELLHTYAQDGSLLAEHPLAGKIPAVECATGTLGHGLAIAAGMAGGLKINGSSGRIFVLLGDGECNEGSVWEAAALATCGKLDNLVAVVDCNGLQACGSCSEISPAVNLPELWKAHGWECKTVDGHDYPALVRAFKAANRVGRPRVILCSTVKGKGIDFMEGNMEWHYRPVRGQEKVEALGRLGDA